MRFEECIENYKDYAEYMELSNNSIETYLNNCKWFFESVCKDVDDIKKADVNKFLMSYKKDHSQSSLELMVRSLNSFYSIIIDELELVHIANPISDIKLPKRKVEQEHHMALTKDEILELINNAKNNREKAMLMFMFNTGVRFSEMSHITLKQYLDRTENNEIMLIVTKGGKPRKVYLSDSTCEMIDKYIACDRKSGCDKLFVSNQGTEMNRVSCSRTWKCLAKRAGFDDEKIAKLSNHCLRSSYGSYLINDLNTPIPLVSSSMGHSDIATGTVLLKNYYHADDDKVQNVMKKVI